MMLLGLEAYSIYRRYGDAMLAFLFVTGYNAGRSNGPWRGHRVAKISDNGNASSSVSGLRVAR